MMKMKYIKPFIEVLMYNPQNEAFRKNKTKRSAS